MMHYCGCENSCCEPDEMIAPSSLPPYTLQTVEGHIISSVNYLDVGAFLYPQYLNVNSVVDAICL